MASYDWLSTADHIRQLRKAGGRRRRTEPAALDLPGSLQASRRLLAFGERSSKNVATRIKSALDPGISDRELLLDYSPKKLA